MNNNNNGGNYNKGKEDVPNKVSFSSVKLGQTKQGSPTIGLYLKREQLEKLVTLGAELLEAGEDGCKIGCIVIEGKDYNSGYAYVNAKEARTDNQAQGQSQGSGYQNRGGNGGGGYRKPSAPTRNSARTFLAGKKLASGNETPEGN
jgi:hypothetical protein